MDGRVTETNSNPPSKPESKPERAGAHYSDSEIALILLFERNREFKKKLARFLKRSEDDWIWAWRDRSEKFSPSSQNAIIRQVKRAQAILGRESMGRIDGADDLLDYAGESANLPPPTGGWGMNRAPMSVKTAPMSVRCQLKSPRLTSETPVAERAYDTDVSDVS